MAIIRGTTPTITFSFDLDWSLVQDLNATFEQNDRDVLVIEKNRFTYLSNEISATLTQEECLLFKNSKCEIQLKVKTTDNKILASDIIVVQIKKILNEEVM